MRTHKPVIRRILTYYIETRSEAIKTRQQTEVSELKVLRRFTKKMRRDRERYENIRWTSEMDNIGDWTTRKRMRRIE